MTNDRAMLQRMQVALDANAAAYRRAVQTSAPGDCWDFVVLTAANEKQAQGYRQELALRHRSVGPTGAFFPAIQKSMVVADPPGRRAGSGGATLGVLRALAEQYRLGLEDLSRLRILLIHSGGASQRLPAYSPLGKIFAPLPLLRPDGQISTLFDHLYLTLAGLPERLGPGMLIVAGDVFLLFDHRHVSAPPPGVTALTMRVEAELGRGHGVFVTDAQLRIQHTLQKVGVETMRSAGAMDEQGRVLIDTGLLFFDGERTKLAGRMAGCGGTKGLQEQFTGQIDLYEDMTGAMAAGTEREAYQKPGAVAELRRKLWPLMHGIPFQVMQLEGQFLHLGTTRQFRDAMVGHNPSPAAELFQQNVLAHSAWPLGPGRRVYHSVLLADGPRVGTIAPGSVVEHSILAGASHVGQGSVVSQVLAARQPIELGDNLLLFQVPVRDADGRVLVVHVVCGVDDDFKGSYPAGQCLFLNRPIEGWMKRHGISAAEVWPEIPDEKRTLWTARLFLGTDERDAAADLMWIARDAAALGPALAAWRRGPRYSMAMLLEQADPVALIEHREMVWAYLQASALLESIKRQEDRPVESFIGHYSTAAAYEASRQLLAQWAAPAGTDAGMSLQQARALWCGAQLLQRPDYPDPAAARQQLDAAMAGAFAKIAEASELGHRQARAADGPEVKLTPGVAVEAAAPVRLDLAGGWSDTPPYCFERGGHVVNVAINLAGQAPVRAIVRTIDEPKLVLESHDLGRQAEVTSLEPGAAVDVHDPFALHKVALEMVGLLPGGGPLSRRLQRLGAGLMVSTECRVPKGSGLGTSSILSAALLAALHEAAGRRASAGQLIEQTLILEQRLSTGGGWQDQVGGIVGGIKSTMTQAGVPQQPNVEALALTEAQLAGLEERLVVYYSGQQRLARDILRRVVGRWLGREPAALGLLDELKASAAALRGALLKGQWSAIGREIARYWRIKKDLYPGSTTPAIDVLFLELRDHYVAAGLAGAGGGGFAYFYCKDGRQARQLRQILAERSARPGSMGSLFDTQINREGLVVRRM